jgi:threonine aldolase
MKIKRKAKELKDVLDTLSFIRKVEPVDTNIVIFTLSDGVDESNFNKRLEEKKIRFISMGQGKLRLVTHRDYSQAQHEYVVDILKTLKF